MQLFIHNHQITAEEESGSHFMVVDGTKGNSSHGKREVPILPKTLSVLRRDKSVAAIKSPSAIAAPSHHPHHLTPKIEKAANADFISIYSHSFPGEGGI